MPEIDNWLECQPQANKFVFSFVRIIEKNAPTNDIVQSLQEKIIFSYNPEDFYTHHFKGKATEDEIRKYVIDQVIPAENNQFDRNVRQGDWGEMLAALIVAYFQKLEIPINKLQWKLNKDKAVFGTDLIAFNNSDKIEDIYYYEIKTRKNPQNKEGKKGEVRQYISVLAYNSLLKDAQSPTESIANFLEKLYVFKNDYDTAEKFADIIKNPQNYNKKYELFLIVEAKNFPDCMLDELDSLSPALSPLRVTVVLIDNLAQLVSNTWNDIENVLVKKHAGAESD